MTGWTLKINDGMKQGSFNPTTGAVYNPPSLPFYNYDYQAGHDFLIKLYKAPNVKIFKGKLDDNIPAAVWGGKFGDDGYQVPSYNLWLNQSSGVELKKLESTSSPTDCIYVGESPDFITNFTSGAPRTIIDNCTFSNAGRNVMTYAGGYGAIVSECKFHNAGVNAVGISGHASGPASCLDVEAEGGEIGKLTFNDCIFFNGGDVSVVAGYPVPADVSNVTFNDCIIHCSTGEYAFINYAGNCKLYRCTIYGGINLDTQSKREATYHSISTTGNSILAGFLKISASPMLIEFAIGMLIAEIYDKLPHRNIGGNSWLLLAFGLSVYFMLFASKAYFTHGIFGFGAWALFLIIPALIYEKTNELKKSKILVFLGDISYPLYITHIVTAVIISNYNMYVPAYSYASGVSILMIYLVASIFVAYLVHTLIEKPMHKLSRRFIGKL